MRDGQVWTSAGVTAGLDLALALVAADHGDALAHEVARWLVLFTRRPGGQAQFMARVADHLDADLSVPALAARTRLEAAQRALQQGDDSIPVVATRCGFGSVAALHRQHFRSAPAA